MSIKMFKRFITFLALVMIVGTLTSCGLGEQGIQEETGLDGKEDSSTASVEIAEETELPSVETPETDAGDDDIYMMQNAKTVYLEYIAENADAGSEFMVYESDGGFVAIHNGEPVGVYASLELALKDMVGEEYLSRYGLTYDEVLTTTDFDLSMPTFGKQENNAVGALVADAFHWAMGDLAAEDGYTGHTVAVTADGVLRAAILAGEVTASEAFDVLSMGVGEDGTSGFPLVSVYLTGKEIKAAMEVDASVTPIMPAAQLYMSGVHYSFNTHRMFFNRVTRSAFDEPGYRNGFQSHTLTKIEDGELYRVVTGMYSAQMLSTVKEKSMGLLSLVPKDAQGQPITDFTKHIVYDQDGNELKEWYALAAYLQSFGEDGIHDWYAIQNESIGAKSVSDSWNILEHLVNWNWITWAVLGVILLAILLVVLILRVIRCFWRKRRSA